MYLVSKRKRGCLFAKENASSLSPATTHLHHLLRSSTLSVYSDYAVQSPDWLEFGKAQDALWNLGIDGEMFCEPLYHEDECEDLGFIDEDGNGCDVYEDERWCAEFGSVENEEGVTAGEACCACGGGEDVVDEL